MTIPEKLKVLEAIAGKLNEEKITWGIGASLLLYFKGISPDFNDIDMMVIPEDAQRVKDILCSMGELLPAKPDGKYRTRHFYEFVIDGVDIDVLGGFRIVTDGIEYDCPFTSASIQEYCDLNGTSIPLQSVSDWRRFYELMGRDRKVRMIDDHAREQN